MWRDKLKFELVGCGLMLLAFVIASGIGFFAVLLSGSAELAAAVMVVSFIAVCWAGDRQRVISDVGSHRRISW